jgi:hypothetical protein
MSGTKAGVFQQAARETTRRLWLVRWLRLLAVTAPAVFTPALLLAFVAWWRGSSAFNLAGAVALVLAWLSALAGWAWLRRPPDSSALAVWDQRAVRHEMFVSAWFFEAQPSRSAAEELHLVRASERLAQDRPLLRQHLPARLAPHAWAAPLFYLLLAGLVFGPRAVAKESPLDRAARAKAREVAAKLAERFRAADKDKGLSAEEVRRMNELKERLRQTAEDLGKDRRKTQREALSELEQRAHEAERLAESLQPDEDDLPSSAMIEELERHADTAELGSSLRAKDRGKASDESRKLGEKLEQKDLTIDERERIKQAFEDALRAADKKDKAGLVSKHLQEAKDRLKSKQPKQAAQQLHTLSRRLAQSLQRLNAQKQLQQLASQLRNSGQQIFGQNGNQVQRLAQLSSTNLQALGAKQLQAVPGTPGASQLLALIPGQAPPGSQPPKYVIPGANLPGNPAGMIPGTGNNPAGAIPVPGSSGMPVPGATPGSAGGAGVPIPGTAAGSCPAGANAAGGSPGGLEAGVGTAPLGAQATQALKAAGTVQVGAAVGKDGPSSVRAVDSGPHAEEVQRKTRQLAVAALRAEEEALAEERLPLGRREEVLRYFTAIRRQLSDEPAADKPSKP